LRNKLLNPSGGGTPVPPPLISSEGNVLITWSVSQQVQNNYDTRFGTCIPSSENPPLKNLDHGNKAPIVLATFGRPARWSLFGRTNKATRLGSNGGHNDENVHRPP
jgi:hypothetical protein